MDRLAGREGVAVVIRGGVACFDLVGLVLAQRIEDAAAPLVIAEGEFAVLSDPVVVRELELDVVAVSGIAPFVDLIERQRIAVALGREISPGVVLAEAVHADLFQRAFPGECQALGLPRHAEAHSAVLHEAVFLRNADRHGDRAAAPPVDVDHDGLVLRAAELVELIILFSPPDVELCAAAVERREGQDVVFKGEAFLDGNAVLNDQALIPVAVRQVACKLDVDAFHFIARLKDQLFSLVPRFPVDALRGVEQQVDGLRFAAGGEIQRVLPGIVQVVRRIGGRRFCAEGIEDTGGPAVIPEAEQSLVAEVGAFKFKVDVIPVFAGLDHQRIFAELRPFDLAPAAVLADEVSAEPLQAVALRPGERDALGACGNADLDAVAERLVHIVFLCDPIGEPQLPVASAAAVDVDHNGIGLVRSEGMVRKLLLRPADANIQMVDDADLPGQQIAGETHVVVPDRSVYDDPVVDDLAVRLLIVRPDGDGAVRRLVGGHKIVLLPVPAEFDGGIEQEGQHPGRGGIVVVVIRAKIILLARGRHRAVRGIEDGAVVLPIVRVEADRRY